MRHNPGGEADALGSQQQLRKLVHQVGRDDVGDPLHLPLPPGRKPEVLLQDLVDRHERGVEILGPEAWDEGDPPLAVQAYRVEAAFPFRATDEADRRTRNTDV